MLDWVYNEPCTMCACVSAHADDDGGLMQGEDGELGEMVATGLREYFESEEGRGAWKLALGKYMLVSDGVCVWTHTDTH